MITPTVGRKVWYRPAGFDLGAEMMIAHDGKPLDATVVAVNGSGTVNLSVFDSVARHFVRLDIPLVQDGEAPPDGAYAEWMPYQNGQAKKEKPTDLL